MSLKKTIDEKAAELLELQAKRRALGELIDQKRGSLMKLVQKHGVRSTRGTKTLLLEGDEYELALRARSETSIDENVAMKLEASCPKGIFARLFRRVDKFVLVERAHEVIQKLPAGAPRNLRRMFARAIRVRELTPQLEVEKISERTRG